MLEKVLLVIFGGIVGSIITSRFEVWKAWHSYGIVRLEIDRNLRVLDMVKRAATPTYDSDCDNRQRQIDQMIDECETKLPVRIMLLDRENMPNWTHKAWESQLHLLAQILTDAQARGIFDIQVDLERLSSIHVRLSNLVATHRDSARNRALDLWNEWESIATRTLQKGNHLLAVRNLTKIVSILGLGRLILRRNTGLD